jgi:hypothetical protein
MLISISMRDVRATVRSSTCRAVGKGKVRGREGEAWSGGRGKEKVAHLLPRDDVGGVHLKREFVEAPRAWDEGGGEGGREGEEEDGLSW